MGKFPATLFAFFAFFLLFTDCLASDWQEDPAISQGANEKKRQSADAPTVLRGRVEHAEKMPAMSDDLRAGASFNPASMPQARYASNWFRIPSWFAGTFECSESVIDYVKDYATGKAARPDKAIYSAARELHGFQKDAGGDIWHFYVQSGSSRSEQASQVTFNNIDCYGPVYVGKDRVIMRIQATSLIVDRNSGIIVDSFRREDIKTYEPSGDALKVTYTSKSFDSHGLPRDLQNGHSLYRRIAPFRAIDSEGEKDYRQMFKDFISNEQK